MTMRMFASYRAVVAATLVAAGALAACEPASLSMATPDYSSALDWAQLERVGATPTRESTPAETTIRVSHRPAQVS